MLRNAILIDENEIRTDVVGIGSKITIYDKEYGEHMDLVIVGSAEADPAEGMISNESPVGAALLGHKAGDIVDVVAPDGIVQYEIKDITR